MIKNEKSGGIHRIGPYTIIKRLADSRFHVYLVSSPENKRVVLKVFVLSNTGAPFAFKNEHRFLDFKNLNIVNILGSSSKAEEQLPSEKRSVSFIVMSYAPFGDLGSLVLRKNHLEDMKLVRTIFKKTLNGL
jgi:serine/threonine protein kinase